MIRRRFPGRSQQARACNDVPSHVGMDLLQRMILFILDCWMNTTSFFNSRVLFSSDSSLEWMLRLAELSNLILGILEIFVDVYVIRI